MAIVAYLNFKNESEEVVKFYEKALDGSDVIITRFEDLPADPSYSLPENEKKLIANASVKIAGGVIMLSDIPDFMAEGFVIGNNISLSIILKDKELIKKYFSNLLAGGKEIMPLGETPWSPLYGMVIDKFGISWQFDYSDEDYYY